MLDSQPPRRSSGSLQRVAKRALDIVASALGLVVLSPLLLAIAIGMRLWHGPPVLFRQPRPGRDGRPFVLLKFRTMTDARDEKGRLLPDVERMTPLGRALRAMSLDELPELVNVLKGDMSLVGPRPLLVDYLERYTQEQARRHLVRPGVTGLAQISGRNTLDWPTRLALDVWYVDHWSLWLDIRILARTIVSVVKHDGITPHGQPTMPEFRGTDRE